MKSKHCPVILSNKPWHLLRPGRCLNRWSCIVAAGLWFVAVTGHFAAYANTALVGDLARDQMLVRELMRLDTELALQQSRERLKALSDRTDTLEALAQASDGKLKLAAIYGVGKKLMAQVVIDGKPHVYLRGKAEPVGQKPEDAVYKLRDISGSCVHLEYDEHEQTLCLQPALKVAR